MTLSHSHQFDRANPLFSSMATVCVAGDHRARTVLGPPPGFPVRARSVGVR
jgi:hypothetical protein